MRLGGAYLSSQCRERVAIQSSLLCEFQPSERRCVLKTCPLASTLTYIHTCAHTKTRPHAHTHTESWTYVIQKCMLSSQHTVFPHCEIGASERWNYVLAARVIFLTIQLQSQDSVTKITPKIVYSYQESMRLCWSPPANVNPLALKAHINPHTSSHAPTGTDPQTHHWPSHFDDRSPSVCKPEVPRLQSVCTLSGKPVEMFIILRLTLLGSSVLVDLGRGS